MSGITFLNVFKLLWLDFYIKDVMHFPMAKQIIVIGKIRNYCVYKLILHYVYIEKSL